MDDGIEHTPSGWLESLMRSKAQIEAGETVPVGPVLDRLRDSIERMAMRASANTKRSTRKA